MIKKVFSVFMTFLFLLATSEQLVVIVHFKLNQEMIAQKFCINKNKPELQCNGNCHLKNELKKTENSNSEKAITYKNLDLALFDNFEFIVKIPKFQILKNAITYRPFEHSEPHLEIFVPPPIF